MSRFLEFYSRLTRAVVMSLVAVSAIGLLTMLVVTCCDILLRLCGSGLVGAYDIVKIAGAITVAAGLPYTTAVKGHVAIEYFFLKLSPRGRVLVDTVSRLLTMALFGALAVQCIQYGRSLKAGGQVTQTLEIPVFWIPHVLAGSCIVIVLVIFHHLVHPGKETIQP